MRIKRFLAVLLCVFSLSSLCGCDLFSTENDQLLVAPQLTGELRPIIKALESRIGQNYILRYPSGGDRKSAVVLKDINDDGKDEAFAFYSTNDSDMHLCMIIRSNNGWNCVDERKLTAGGVERIDFFDIDEDGVEEILVGWEIHGTSEKQLAVYSFKNKKLKLMLLQKYTAYKCCDLDEDGKGEIFIQLLNPTESSNRAYLFVKDGDELVEFSSCAMDRNVKSIISQTVSLLSSGQYAVYVDELKSAGAVTEVFYLTQGKLVNPLLDTTSGENLKTERAATLVCRDVNHDELLEIPVSEEILSVTGSTEKCYYTKWCTFNGENLTTQGTYLINQNDGFYLAFPEKWVGNIAVYHDTEKRIRRFYNIDDSGAPAELFAELRIVDPVVWENPDYSKSGLQEICRNEKNIIVGAVYDNSGKISINIDELKKIIYIIE